MKYKIGDKIIFNKEYYCASRDYLLSYSTKGARGWIEEYLVNKVMTITGYENGWYLIEDFPGKMFCEHGYDEGLFSLYKLQPLELE